MAYQVYDLRADEMVGEFDTLDEARGCVSFGRMMAYEIQQTDAQGDFVRVVTTCNPDDDFDPENIYNLPTIEQSIAEDRARRH